MIIDGRNLSLIYDVTKEEATYAVNGFDISLKKREFTGIMGPSGSGKSSLLYLLSGIKKPTSGTVFFDDVDIESYSQSQKDSIRRSKFGFIFQKHFLIEYLTVLDNVLVSVNRNDSKDREKALELLEKLKMGHLADRKPFQLSGGQRQRIAVARALINDPEVIFADEPTSSLDHSNAREVMNVLEELKNRALIIVVTHDRSILENADRVIEMWDGHLR